MTTRLDFTLSITPNAPVRLYLNDAVVDEGTMEEMKEAARECIREVGEGATLMVVEETMERTLIHDVC